MIPTTKKGQTALEYLLIVVVAIIVVVAVMVWMNAASSGATGSATKSSNEVLCRSASCTSNSACTSGTGAEYSACKMFSAGMCANVQNIGGTTIAGKCAPNASATYTAGGSATWS